MTSTSHCKAGSSSWHQEREQPSNSSPINLQVVCIGFRLAAKAKRILATASLTANVGSCQRLCKTSSRTNSSDQKPWLMMRLCQPMMVCSSFWCCRPVNCGQTPELYMSFEQTNASRSCSLVGIEIRLLAKRGLDSCLKVVVAAPMRLLISPPKCKPWPKQVPKWTYCPTKCNCALPSRGISIPICPLSFTNVCDRTAGALRPRNVATHPVPPLAKVDLQASFPHDAHHPFSDRLNGIE